MTRGQGAKRLGIFLRCVSPLLAHSDALRQRSTSVAFGAKRTLTKAALPGAAHLLRKGLRERTAAPPPERMRTPATATLGQTPISLKVAVLEGSLP
jgi:hypothetical protein